MYALRRMGQKFGDLKVIGTSFTIGGAIWWPCLCKCGNNRGVEEKRLVSGKITCCIPCEIKRKMEKPIVGTDS